MYYNLAIGTRLTFILHTLQAVHDFNTKSVTNQSLDIALLHNIKNVQHGGQMHRYSYVCTQKLARKEFWKMGLYK